MDGSQWTPSTHDRHVYHTTGRRALIDVINLPSVKGVTGWIHVSRRTTIPEDAGSIDIVVSAPGEVDASQAAIDDLCAYGTTYGGTPLP